MAIQGITIELRGKTTQLEQALRKVNKEIRDTDKELRDVDKALKLDPKNVDLWRSKQDLLKNKISETKDKLKALKDGLAQMDANGVDHTTEDYKSLERQIAVTEAELKQFNTELKKTGNANLTALSEQLKSIGSKMTEVGKNMTTKVTAPIVAGYTLAANYASDYEENLNKIDVAFGENSKSVKEWAKTAGKEFGLSKVQATDAASAFGALGKGIGLSEAEAAGMSTTLAGLSADLGSYFNVGVDESAKALEGIFTGESEALKKFGVVMTDTNLQQFAEDQGLVWKEMSQTEKTMLRYQYVLDKTKDAQGDFSRTSDGTANSTKIFKASIQDLATSIGTNLLPIITPIIQKITEWINKFNELSPRAKKVITIVGLVVAAIGPLLVVFGTLISSIGAVVGAIGLITAPMLGVVALITAAVAIIVWFIKHWEDLKAEIKAFGIFLNNTLKQIDAEIKAVWNSIKTATITAWNKIKSSISAAINNAKTAVRNTVTSIKTALSNAWASIKSSASNAWNSIKEKITSPFEKAKETISGIIDKIKGWFPISIGNIFKGLKTPHFSLNWSSKDFGKLGSIKYPTGLGVSWYKTGGIFDSPSFIGVGEAGPEAVVPLDKFWTAIENSNARTDALLAKQNVILMAVLEELSKEKNFKVDGAWAGRYVNSLVR